MIFFKKSTILFSLVFISLIYQTNQNEEKKLERIENTIKLILSSIKGDINNKMLLNSNDTINNLHVFNNYVSYIYYTVIWNFQNNISHTKIKNNNINLTPSEKYFNQSLINDINKIIDRHYTHTFKYNITNNFDETNKILFNDIIKIFTLFLLNSNNTLTLNVNNILMYICSNYKIDFINHSVYNNYNLYLDLIYYYYTVKQRILTDYMIQKILFYLLNQKDIKIDYNIDNINIIAFEQVYKIYKNINNEVDYDTIMQNSSILINTLINDINKDIKNNINEEELNKVFNSDFQNEIIKFSKQNLKDIKQK